MYLSLKNKDAHSFVESEFTLLVPDLEFEEFVEGKSELTREHKNLTDVLMAWQVPTSKIWKKQVHRFSDFKNLEKYLISKGQLGEDGNNLSHELIPTLSAKPIPEKRILVKPEPRQLALNWSKLSRKMGGPSTNKQVTFVEAIANTQSGIRPEDLATLMNDWKDPIKCSKSMAKRINDGAKKRGDPWRINPSDRGNCLIVHKNALQAIQAVSKKAMPQEGQH